MRVGSVVVAHIQHHNSTRRQRHDKAGAAFTAGTTFVWKLTHSLWTFATEQSELTKTLLWYWMLPPQEWFLLLKTAAVIENRKGERQWLRS